VDILIRIDVERHVGMTMEEKHRKILLYLLDKLVDFAVITAAVTVGVIIAVGFIARHMSHALGG